MTLTPALDSTRELTVETELKLGGKLAVLGAKLIHVKFKEVFAEAIANLKGKLRAEKTV